ncbi:MAG: glycosyltransferase [Planctomycetota bacterium]
MPQPPRKPRIALAHDWLVARRGGEHVLEAIIDALTGEYDIAGILTMFDTGEPIARRIDDTPRHASRLNRLPLGLSASARRHLLPLYPLAVAELSRRLARMHAQRPIDLVISSHSAAIKAIRPPAGVPHLCYCHTPARYIWSQTHTYGPAALPLAMIRPFYRAWDRATAKRVTSFLANSAHTAEQIRRCYKRKADVLHPPVRTGFFTPSPEGEGRVPRGHHWLVVGALVPYKRFDLAIRAANEASHPLTVVGDGPGRQQLRSIAGSTVTFVHDATDAQLRDHYRRAAMLIYPQQEDFGITAPEALACGMPVVAYDAGGARDTVTDGVTGALFPTQTVESMLAAIDRCPKHRALVCREHAERFEPAAFREGIRRHARALVRV